MGHPDQPDFSGGTLEPSQGSLTKTIDRAKRAIAAARAQIARSQALGQSLVDLTRELERASPDESDATHGPKDGAEFQQDGLSNGRPRH